MLDYYSVDEVGALVRTTGANQRQVTARRGTATSSWFAHRAVPPTEPGSEQTAGVTMR